MCSTIPRTFDQTLRGTVNLLLHVSCISRVAVHATSAGMSSTAEISLGTNLLHIHLVLEYTEGTGTGKNRFSQSTSPRDVSKVDSSNEGMATFLPLPIVTSVTWLRSVGMPTISSFLKRGSSYLFAPLTWN
jgi:hypothetical protein